MHGNVSDGKDDKAGGRLILVVGPSGAGKDRLIRGAQDRLATESGIRFPQRDITRGGNDGHEAHNPVSEETFEARRTEGAYLLSWRAHGYGYGVPASVQEDLDAGIDVVVNVSRTVIADARRRVPNCRVVLVTAPRGVLDRRLQDRGRDSAEGRARRLDRAAAPEMPAANTVIVNDDDFETALDAFVDVVKPDAAPLRPAAVSAATAPPL